MSLEVWQQHFPAHANRHLLKITEEGKYSITREKEAHEMWKVLPKLIPTKIKNLVVLDGTSNVGSDAIRWAQRAKHVHAIELDPQNYVALINNIKVYDLLNVDPHLGDTTRLYYRWKHDLLYLDPPWGGPDYYTKKSLDLFMGHIPLTTLLEKVVAQKHPPRFIVLKLPKNFNFNSIPVKAFPKKTLLRKVWVAKFYLYVIIFPEHHQNPNSKYSPSYTSPITKQLVE